jgi:predicted small integral membrane protein
MSATRWAKIVMTASIALFLALVTFDNITDYGSNFMFVRHVLSMDTTFPHNALMYRAITDPALWALAYWIIIATEGVSAVAVAIGAVSLWRHRGSTASRFQRAKEPFIFGAILSFLLWFTGFTIIGGEWFSMWQSREWNGQQEAFRITLTLLAVLIFVMQPEREPAENERNALP